MYFTPANSEKLAGINRVKEFLKLNPKKNHIKIGQPPAPRLYIMKNCVNLLWELPQYQWRKLRSLAQRNSPEQPRDFSDHLCDSLRYTIMSRFPAPLKRYTGFELILPEERRNMNLINQPFPQNYVGDEELGQMYGSFQNDKPIVDSSSDKPIVDSSSDFF